MYEAIEIVNTRIEQHRIEAKKWWAECVNLNDNSARCRAARRFYLKHNAVCIELREIVAEFKKAESESLFV